MSFSSFSYRSPKKFKATSSSTIRSTPSKSPTNEWNSYLTDDHKFRLSNDEIIKKKQLMISKHNILMSGTSNGASSFNSSTSATTPTTSRSKTKAKPKTNTNTNTNANAKNIRQYSKKTKNNNFEEDNHEEHEDRDYPRTHKREAFTSLDLLTAEISEEEEDEVTDEDDYQPVYQPHHKHHNHYKNQYHKNGKGVEEDKHHEQNSSGDEGDKEEETENIHEIYQNEFSKKKKIPSSRKSSKISSLSSSSFSSSTPRTTTSTSTKGSKTRQLSSQNKGIKTSSTQRPSPLTQSQQKDLQEIQQMIQSLHQELKYYEELSGRRSFLDVEELSSVVATGSADQGEGPGEGKDAMTSQLTTMRYLVQLVCQTMTYLLKSEIELNKQNENYLQLSTKINQLFYLYSQSQHSQHSQHPQEQNLQYSNFKSYDSTQMTPPSHSNIHPPPPPPQSDISDRTIPLYSHGGTPSSDSHSAISTPSSFSEFSNNSSIMKKKNQVTFSLPNSGVSTATSTPRTEYSTPSMPFRESKLGTSSTDWLFQTTKDLLTQSTPTSNYNTYSPATSQQQQQLQQQSSSLSKDSNFITMNSNDRYERMTTNTNTNTPTTPSSPYSASVNNPPSFPSPSPLLTSSSSYPQQPNRLLELQQQIAIMKHDNNGINGHGHIKEATITPQSSSPFSAYHSDPLKQWLKWTGESPQPTRGLITTRAMNSLDDINNLSLHPPSAPSAPPPPPPPMPSQPLSSSTFSSSSSSHYFESTKTIHLPRTQNLSKNIHEESDSETEKNTKKTRGGDEDEEEEEEQEEEEEHNQDEEMPLHQIYKSNNFLTPPTNRLSSTSASSSSSSASKGSSHSHSHPPSHVEEEEPSSQHLLSSSLLPTPERAPQHPHTSTLNNIPLYPSSNKMKSTNSSPNMKFQRSYDARNGSYGMK